MGCVALERARRDVLACRSCVVRCVLCALLRHALHYTHRYWYVHVLGTVVLAAHCDTAIDFGLGLGLVQRA